MLLQRTDRVGVLAPVQRASTFYRPSRLGVNEADVIRRFKGLGEVDCDPLLRRTVIRGLLLEGRFVAEPAQSDRVHGKLVCAPPTALRSVMLDLTYLTLQVGYGTIFMALVAQ